MSSHVLLLFNILLLINSILCAYRHRPDEAASPSHPRGHRRLRIAQIASLYQPVPAIKYGAIERIIYHLTDELVNRGHEVTLFASSDSKTPANAKLVSKWPSLFSMAAKPEMTTKANDWLMDEVRRRAHEFDILHFHTDFHFDQVEKIRKETGGKKVLVTVHNLMSSYPELCVEYNQIPIVTLSRDQQTHFAKTEKGEEESEQLENVFCKPNFIGHVYYGLPLNLYKFVKKPAGDEHGRPYLAFLGRIHPNKMPDWAIEIAVKARIPLKIAAKKEKFFDNNDQYWQQIIKPLVEKNSDIVEFIGEIDDVQKNTFLGNALALLFPINWPEPFGLVMLESIACGTPVITRRGYGSVPEVIQEGLTGQLFSTIEEGVEAVERIREMDRWAIRKEFERRFLVGRMAADYEQVYGNLMQN